MIIVVVHFCTSVIPAVEKLRQEDGKFKASLSKLRLSQKKKNIERWWGT